MMEVVQTSETLVNSYQSTWRCNPEDSHLRDVIYLFNDVFITSDYTVSNERMIANNELKRMWKEQVWPNLRFSSGIWLEGLWKTMRNPSQVSQSVSGLRFEPGTSKMRRKSANQLSH
jgi:hypothetical protein